MKHLLSEGTNLTPNDIITLSKLFGNDGYLKVHRTSGMGKAILREAEDINDKMLSSSKKKKVLSFDQWLKKEKRYREYQDAGPSDSKEIEADYYAYEREVFRGS